MKIKIELKCGYRQSNKPFEDTKFVWKTVSRLEDSLIQCFIISVNHHNDIFHIGEIEYDMFFFHI